MSNSRPAIKRNHDPVWHLQTGVLGVIILQLLTSSSLLPYNKILLVLLEIFLMMALVVVTPDAYNRVSHPRRMFALSLIAIITIANIVSLLLLLSHLVIGGSELSGRTLLLNGVTIYVTNVFMFALWFWQLDGGGPEHRVQSREKIDFLFTQMVHPEYAAKNWLPGFTDYLYLSATNMTNFASADTVPVSHRAKLLMMIQSLVAVITVVLVAARAISILQ